MLFSSNIFLFLFLPATLIGYYLLHPAYRNTFLLAASLIFYAWGEPKFVLVMIASILFNYSAARLIDFAKSQRRKKFLSPIYILWFCLAGNLALLFSYKYLDFFLVNVNRLAGSNFPLSQLALPIGISFFTFQAMSYVIDVYRGVVKVQSRLHHVGLYIAFFPQLIAGPIVRYQDIARQIEKRTVNFADFSVGLERFVIGLSKKVILANNLALIADRAFALPATERSVIFAWLGIIAYALQILFDFSGYSDMAIGLGKMFGFRFLENFNYPYLASSISEFWRRWHMSLGQWFRDYVYFPLGGSRVKTRWRLIFNLFVVWIFTGVWHGASWNFIAWGFWYFLLIAFERLFGYPQRLKTTTARTSYRIFTLLGVLAGWVLFRAPGGRAALDYGLSLLAIPGNPLWCDYVILTFREYWLFLLVAILCSTQIFSQLKARVSSCSNQVVRFLTNVSLICFHLFCFFWSVSFIILGTYNPFIYFNF